MSELALEYVGKTSGLKKEKGNEVMSGKKGGYNRTGI